VSYSNFIADLLVESGCYVNASTDENLIQVPTGDLILAYLSCRLLISKVREREIIEEMLSEVVQKSFSSDSTVVGIATAGIPWGYGIASRLKLPMLYTRSNEKGYGLGGLIEGDVTESFSEAILVDDVLYTGSSVISAQKALEQKNIKTVGIVCIASLNDKVVEYFREQGIRVIALTNYNDILVSAENRKVLNQEEVNVMKMFYERR